METPENVTQSNGDGFNMGDRMGERGGRGGRGGRGRGGGRGMGGGRGRGRGGMSQDNRPARLQEDRVLDRLQALQGQTLEMPPRDLTEPKKFTNHCRLFVGNIPPDMKKEELEELFKKFGETSEIFLNTEKAFAFIKLDFRTSAEKAKTELDGHSIRGRSLKIRFAAHGAALRIKNIPSFVSNELLEKSFAVFGEIENAIVNVDSKGKATGEGKVEFCSKPAAMLALKMCTEGCFFLTRSPCPVVVEMLVEEDIIDGCPEKTLSKRHPDFKKEREVAPRFAPPGSFEFEYGSSWKALYDLQRQKLEALEAEMKYEKEKLQEQMEFARFEHESNMLRDQLRKCEMERERQMRETEMRQRQRDEQRQREEEMYRSRQEEMRSGLLRREEEMKRRAQENLQFMDGGAYRGEQQGGYSSREFPKQESNMERGANMPPDPKSFMENFSARDGGNFPPGYEQQQQQQQHKAGWGEREDYGGKRRRWQ